MAIVAVSVTPIGEGPSVSRFVAAAHRVLESFPELTYRVDPMFTTIEGDLDRVIEAIRRMHEAPFELGAVRVSTFIKIDDRRDKETHMEDKVRSVVEKL
ncbi:MAG: MTH1187 family thiamine-binding protein [Clostridia bacterium]|nr:MTH1187 family thiamine-binding protein [Clostridia bacterium]